MGQNSLKVLEICASLTHSRHILANKGIFNTAVNVLNAQQAISIQCQSGPVSFYVVESAGWNCLWIKNTLDTTYKKSLSTHDAKLC